MPRSRKRKSDDGSRLFDSTVCAFCGTDYDDEIQYGKFVSSDDISLHSYCMFFASGLSQHGENETDGLFGFLPSDIQVELRRGKKLYCSYCRKGGATIGCCEKKCKKSFHLPCGIEHESLNQHFGSFSSFCKAHKPKQQPVTVTRDLYCYICCEEIPPSALTYCLYSPCCNNSWFHKKCLQKYALSAGRYFFKCPLCNNSKEFVQEMEKHGICIPEKDASWELEENAYQELLVRPGCEVEICLCPKGRKYNSPKNGSWSLLPCSDCGSHARHKSCENLKLSDISWKCEECKSVEKKICENKESTALDTEVKENLCVKVSTPVQSMNANNPTSSISPPFNPLCLSSSSSSHVTLVPEDQDEKFQLGMPDIITCSQICAETNDIASGQSCTKINDTASSEICTETNDMESSHIHTETNITSSQISTETNGITSTLQVRIEANDICANFNTCMTVSSNNIISTDIKGTDNFKQSKQTSEKDFKYSPHNSKSELTYKKNPEHNLKDIKNISPTVLDSLKKPSTHLKKRTMKKNTKERKMDCPCSQSKHSCIRKYFVQECGKYRL